jgi:hypothetical protein
MKTALRIAFIMAFVLSIGAAAFAQQTNLVSNTSGVALAGSEGTGRVPQVRPSVPGLKKMGEAQRSLSLNWSQTPFEHFEMDRS